jgi:hypothetical protein
VLTIAQKVEMTSEREEYVAMHSKEKYNIKSKLAAKQRDR